MCPLGMSESVRSMPGANLKSNSFRHLLVEKPLLQGNLSESATRLHRYRRGALIGASLLVSTLRQLRQPSPVQSPHQGYLPLPDAIARLVLGASLILLSLF